MWLFVIIFLVLWATGTIALNLTDALIHMLLFILLVAGIAYFAGRVHRSQS